MASTTVPRKTFHTPTTSKTIDRIIALIYRPTSEQATAATAAAGAMTDGIVSYPGVIKRVYLIVTPAAAGESMVYDVKKNGTSILTGTYTYDNTKTTTGLIDITGLLDSTKVNVAMADILKVDRTYTAGGGPTMAANAVYVEYEPLNGN